MTKNMQAKIAEAFANYGGVDLKIQSPEVTIDMSFHASISELENILDQLSPKKKFAINVSSFEERKTYNFYGYLRRFSYPNTVTVYGIAK